MAAVTTPAPAMARQRDAQRTKHVYCVCTPLHALCGTKLTVDLGPLNFKVDCVVCADLTYRPCGRCGA